MLCSCIENSIQQPSHHMRGIHMPELYGRDHLYLNELEMRCSDIMNRYCFCNFHADYPMKFGEAHKYLTFRRYKFLHEGNLPVGETVSQMKFHEGYINTNLMRISMRFMDWLLHMAHRLSSKKREWPGCTHPLAPRSMNV